MLDFMFGYACGAVSTVLLITFAYVMFDHVVRPPRG